MISETLRDAFYYHRREGRPASIALVNARADLVAGKTRYAFNYPAPLCHGWGNARSDNGAVWVERLRDAGLRFVGYADELARSIQHTGWYTEDDNANGETYRGAVVQLAARDGRPLYLAAYGDPINRGAYRVDVSSVIYGEHGEDDEAKRDAAHAADSFAESEAESQRDYNRAWQAGRQFDDLGDDIKRIRRGLLETLAEIKSECPRYQRKRAKVRRPTYGPKVRAILRGHIESALEEIRDIRRKRADLVATYGDQSGFVE